MNTKSTTSRIAVAAAIAGLALAATACGTEQADSPDEAIQPPAKTSLPGRSTHSPDALERAQKARAEHADAQRWARGHRTAVEAERDARAERADALRWAHGN
jgi:hypothetical protein